MFSSSSTDASPSSMFYCGVIGLLSMVERVNCAFPSFQKLMDGTEFLMEKDFIRFSSQPYRYFSTTYIRS